MPVKRALPKDQLPKNFTSLGMSRKIDGVFKIAGITTEKMLEQLRDYTLVERYFAYDKDHQRYYRSVNFKFSATYIPVSKGGESIELELEKVAWPFFEPYLDLQAIGVYYDLCYSFSCIILKASSDWYHGAKEAVHQYCRAHYDNLHDIRLNKESLYNFVVKKVREAKLYKNYHYARRKNNPKNWRHRSIANTDRDLYLFLRDLGMSDEFTAAVKQALYIAPRKEGDCHEE